MQPLGDDCQVLVLGAVVIDMREQVSDPQH